MDNLQLVRVEEDGTVVFSLILSSEFLHVGGEKESHLATFDLLY